MAIVPSSCCRKYINDTGSKRQTRMGTNQTQPARPVSIPNAPKNKGSNTTRCLGKHSKNNTTEAARIHHGLLNGVDKLCARSLCCHSKVQHTSYFVHQIPRPGARICCLADANSKAPRKNSGETASNQIYVTSGRADAQQTNQA